MRQSLFVRAKNAKMARIFKYDYDASPVFSLL